MRRPVVRSTPKMAVSSAAASKIFIMLQASFLEHPGLSLVFATPGQF
jgi:hypothetical protein